MQPPVVQTQRVNVSLTHFHGGAERGSNHADAEESLPSVRSSSGSLPLMEVVELKKKKKKVK